ncbi:MAG: hypothetical protein LAP85_13850 [Acidobacteriia bacterium]|nr:hypothetical protein [Terriglobia bacterium]
MSNAADTGSAKRGRLPRDAGVVLLLAGLCAVAYLPCVNNGFISDDFVILGRLDALQHDFLYLFSIPPECFRLTSYIFFGMLRFLFGYHPAWYYAFNLLLHLINSILIWQLLTRLMQSSRIGLLAAVFFASIQGHQEAVMWLAAMNETLLGLCLLACLLLWERGHGAWSSLVFLAGLFSKESALALLGLLPLLDWRSRGHALSRLGYALIFTISAAFAALFYRLAAHNFMLGTGSYSLGWHGVPVLLRSMHRMMFPWVYLAVILHVVRRRDLAELKPAGWGLGFAAIALVPYVFLTYQGHVTSRQEYIASMGIVWALAVLIHGLDSQALCRAFVILFVAANIGYIWIKDRQFEQRAAPTNRLIEQLRARRPQNLAIVGFPANPWIAKNTARMVPGWQPDMIHVDPPASECGSCPALHWEPLKESYVEFNRR